MVRDGKIEGADCLEIEVNHLHGGNLEDRWGRYFEGACCEQFE